MENHIFSDASFWTKNFIIWAPLVPKLLILASLVPKGTQCPPSGIKILRKNNPEFPPSTGRCSIQRMSGSWETICEVFSSISAETWGDSVACEYINCKHRNIITQRTENQTHYRKGFVFRGELVSTYNSLISLRYLGKQYLSCVALKYYKYNIQIHAHVKF